MWCYENERYKRGKVKQFYVQFWEQLSLLPKRKGVPTNEQKGKNYWMSAGFGERIAGPVK